MAFDGKQIRNATIVGAKLANLTITDTQLAASAVTTGKIADAAVDDSKLKDDAVVTAKILDAAVTTVKILDGNVTRAKLADNAVDATKIADGSVELAKLAANSVDSSKIVDASITGSDIAANTVAQANLATAYETGLLYRDGTRAMSGALDLGIGNKIVNLANPEQAQDAATKAYVDSVATSLDLKASVRVATTADIVLTTSATTSVDGVTLGTNDRVLVKNQTTASQNGIWMVPASGPWTRASDANTNAQVSPGMFTFVEEGVENVSTGWVLTTSGPITVGTTSLAFTQFSGAGSYLAGVGLVLTGNEFNIVFNDVDASVVAVGTQAAGVSNSVARADHSHALGSDAVTTATIADGSVTTAKLANEAVTSAKVAPAFFGSVTGLSVGGTNANGTNATAARSDHTHALPSLATDTVDGFLSAADKTNIDAWTAGTDSGILAGATGDISVNSQKIVSLFDPADPQDAATKAYVDSRVSGAVQGGDITNKNMTASVTTTDGSLACATGMAHTAKGYVQVFVNGLKVVLRGDNTGECYFGADTSTPKALDAVVATDKLFWNGSVAEYQLATSDLISFDYIY